MLNIIISEYNNIWPFGWGKSFVLNFLDGKTIVKAKIGSGKSFLFFDAPFFALYRYSSRNLLNANSQTWYIKMIFELNDEYYLIIRNFKKWKSNDSCNSQFFKISENKDKINSEIQSKIWNESVIIFEKNIDWLLSVFRLEEIKFKNERDLQQNMDLFLPPKEVFGSTTLLIQDSSNIFDIAPAERLKILKNIFDLLDIDNGKKILADKKNELKMKLKVMWDNSSLDLKLRDFLKNVSQKIIENSSLFVDNLKFCETFWQNNANDKFDNENVFADLISQKTELYSKNTLDNKSLISNELQNIVLYVQSIIPIIPNITISNFNIDIDTDFFVNQINLIDKKTENYKKSLNELDNLNNQKKN